MELCPRTDPSVLDRLTNLPVELQCNVLFELLSAETPCAFALFVPDWRVCSHGTDPVNRIYDLQRTDVYTRGTGQDPGIFVSGAAHGDGDHVEFSMRTASANTCVLMEQLKARFPVALDWALRDVERTRLRTFEQVFPRAPDDGIGKCMSHGALVYRSSSSSSSPPGSDEDRLPPRHLMFNGVAKDPWFELRLRRNPETRIGFGVRLFVETEASMVEVDWAVMPQLETVFLDLRSYGRGRVGEEGIRRGAGKMGCLRLRCLVIAGLRSGKWYVRPPGWELCGWEADDREVDGGVNWVKVFCGAVREGGRLVFIDRRIADVDWEGWRARAENDGLLPSTDEVSRDECSERAYLKHVERVMGDDHHSG